MSTVNELLDYGKEQLELSGNEYAKYERKVMLEHILGVNYMYMLINGSEIVTPEKEEEYKKLIELRCEHYPLQYIMGEAHFMDHTFFVDEKVLIPRSDTEVLVETVNELFDMHKGNTSDNGDNADSSNASFNGKDVRVLDLCCGSGCIGISLKMYHNNIALTLSDISKDALKVTQKNLDKYNITDADVVRSDLFEADYYKDGTVKYDIIVCNPPYIESEVINTLMPEVKEHEPHLALDGGEDGLDFYKTITGQAVEYMGDNGYLFFEIGYNQGNAVLSLMKNAGFTEVVIKKDYAGMDRVVYGHL